MKYLSPHRDREEFWEKTSEVLARWSSSGEISDSTAARFMEGDPESIQFIGRKVSRIKHLHNFSFSSNRVRHRPLTRLHNILSLLQGFEHMKEFETRIFPFDSSFSKSAIYIVSQNASWGNIHPALLSRVMSLPGGLETIFFKARDTGEPASPVELAEINTSMISLYMSLVGEEWSMEKDGVYDTRLGLYSFLEEEYLTGVTAEESVPLLKSYFSQEEIETSRSKVFNMEDRLMFPLSLSESLVMHLITQDEDGSLYYPIGTEEGN